MPLNLTLFIVVNPRYRPTLCNCDDNPAVDEARTDVADDVSIISFSSSASAARPADHTVHS